MKSSGTDTTGHLPSCQTVAPHIYFLETILEVGVQPVKHSALKPHLLPEMLQKETMVNSIKSHWEIEENEQGHTPHTSLS